MTKTILSTSNLCIGYKNKNQNTVLAENLNLNIKKGKLTALIGGNGVGKSTLLRTLSALQKPLSGIVFLDKKNIHDLDSLILAQNISVVLTEKLPSSNLSVWELIALGRQPHTNWLGNLTKNDITKIDEAIAITEIGHLVLKKHYEISDGQLQIVLIARALAQDSPIIILDEPTTHLDLVHKVVLLKLLKKLTQEKGKCILFSTHDVDLAIQLSDEMIIMTPEITHQDQPCKLIEKGCFDTLFGNEHIIFDNQKGTFVIKEN